MADNILDEINRSRLDGIVKKAQDNNENDDTIRAIVSDYKSKYGTQPTAVSKTRQSMGGKGPDKPESQIFNESVGHMLPSLVASGASALTDNPAVGGAAGSVVGEGLRRISPSLFGGEDSGSLGEDLGMNTVLPGVMGALSKFASGPRQYIANKLASTFGQKLPAVKSLMGAEKGFQDETHQLFSSAQDASSTAYNDAAKAAELDYRQKIFGKNNPMVKDPNVATPSGFKLPDPNDFTPRSSDLPQGYSGFTSAEPDLSQVKTIIQKAQDSNKGGIQNPVLKYAKNSLTFKLAAMTGLGGVSVPAAIAGSSLVLGDEAIKRLTADPETASLIIKAIKTPGSSEQAGLISKTLMNALRGSAVTLINGDGEKQQAVIDKDGNLTYPRQ